MITDLIDKEQAKVLAIYAISPGSRRQRKDLQAYTGMNNAPLDKTLATLVKNGILTKEKRLYGISFRNKKAKALLETMTEEHQRCKEVPLKIFYTLIELSAALAKERNVKQAYLFGSYAKLTYTQASDVDIAIVLKKEDAAGEKRIEKEIQKIAAKQQENIQTHYLEEKDLEEKDPFIKEITQHGIPLY